MSLFSEIKQSPILETQPQYQAFIARCHEPQNYQAFWAAHKGFIEADAAKFDILVEPKRNQELRRYFKKLKNLDPVCYQRFKDFRTAIGVLPPDLYKRCLACLNFMLLPEQSQSMDAETYRLFVGYGVLDFFYRHVRELMIGSSTEVVPEHGLKVLEPSDEAQVWFHRFYVAYLVIFRTSDGRPWSAHMRTTPMWNEEFEHFDIITSDLWAGFLTAMFPADWLKA